MQELHVHAPSPWLGFWLTCTVHKSCISVCLCGALPHADGLVRSFALGLFFLCDCFMIPAASTAISLGTRGCMVSTDPARCHRYELGAIVA